MMLMVVTFSHIRLVNVSNYWKIKPTSTGQPTCGELISLLTTKWKMLLKHSMYVSRTEPWFRNYGFQRTCSEWTKTHLKAIYLHRLQSAVKHTELYIHYRSHSRGISPQLSLLYFMPRNLSINEDGWNSTVLKWIWRFVAWYIGRLGLCCQTCSRDVTSHRFLFSDWSAELNWAITETAE